MKKIFLLSACLLMGACSFAQYIPNAGFETWAPSGPFLAPTDWAVSPGVIQSSDAHSGSWALQCRVDTFTNPFTSTLDTIPATAYTGAATMTPPAPGTSFGGYQLTAFPDSLIGYYKYQNMANDTFSIIVQMSRWDTTTHSRLIMRQGRFSSGTSVGTYTRFAMRLENMFVVGVPDTAFIQVLACNPQAPKHIGTSIWVDDLSFFTFPDAVNNVPSSSVMVVYPNPFTDAIHINGLNVQKVEVINMFGQIVATTTNTQVNTADLSAGIYFVTITTTNGNKSVKQVVKQ